jgi:hypothetical protein
MARRRFALCTALAAGSAVGIGYPLVDLALACRAPASEACVWGKAYLPLTFGLSIVILGGAVSALVYVVLTRRRPPGDGP